MNIWRIYEYLVQVVHPFMADKGDCLYNALVRKQSEQSDEYLLEVRDSALNIVKMIEQELADRQADRDADEAAFHESVDDGVKCCPDCERPNQFGELCQTCESERGPMPEDGESDAVSGSLHTRW